MIWASRLTIALIVWGALSFGAVYPWGYWPLVVGAGILGLWTIIATRALTEPRPRRLAIALGVVALALIAQIVPVPHHWFTTVTPSADRLLDQLQFGRAAQPAGWHSLSVAPGSTMISLAIFTALALLLVGLMRAVAYMPLRWMVTQLTLFGVALALFGIVQRLISGPSDFPVYGFWKPVGMATPFGPFINRNHFAGWMVLVAPIVVAFAVAGLRAARHYNADNLGERLRWLMTPEANRFVFTATAALVMIAALVLSGSRSGLISLAVALLALGWMAGRQPESRSSRLIPAFLVVVLFVGAMAWAGIGRTAARLEQAQGEFNERVAAWRDTTTIIRDFPIVGTGFGGYGPAMLVYQTADRHSIYEQAHNEYLQILAEGGLLVAVPAAIVIVLLVRNIRHRFAGTDDEATFWLRAGTVAGLVGIAVQSSLEFSLQMPGNALLCVVLLAVALHRPSSRSHAHSV